MISKNFPHPKSDKQFSYHQSAFHILHAKLHAIIILNSIRTSPSITPQNIIIKYVKTRT